MSTTITVAALQMVSGSDVTRNLDTARRLIGEAAEAGATLVALPEYFCLMGRRDTDKLHVAEAPGEGPIQSMLAEAARTHKVWVLGGSMPMRSDDPAHVFNASLVFAPDGTLAARYDKMHLFRFEHGEERYDEGRVQRAGDALVALDTAPFGERALRLGLSICYDLRFPELYRALSRPACDLIAVPSAFTYPTGQAHWSLLLRARAVENQCYVIAPAQGGVHDNGRRTWGHTMIVDPWGEVLAELPEGEAVVMAELSSQRLAEVRSRLPALAHRRL